MKNCRAGSKGPRINNMSNFKPKGEVLRTPIGIKLSPSVEFSPPYEGGVGGVEATGDLSTVTTPPAPPLRKGGRKFGSP